ncbi:hypothetical protein WAI453_002693 [Rhynchosporium graminicola]
MRGRSEEVDGDGEPSIVERMKTLPSQWGGSLRAIMRGELKMGKMSSCLSPSEKVSIRPGEYPRVEFCFTRPSISSPGLP